MRIPIKRHKSTVPLEIKARFENKNTIYEFQDDKWIKTSDNEKLKRISIEPVNNKEISFTYSYYSKNEGFVERTQRESVEIEIESQDTLEGISINLNSPKNRNHDICYQANLEGLGRTQIFSNGEFCGTHGDDYPMKSFKVWIQDQTQEKNISYNNGYFKTSHNSYNLSVRDLLNKGVRGLEYDLHDVNIKEKGEFEVYHVDWHLGTKLGEGGNPSDHRLSSWLNLLVDWSNSVNSNHAPITLFMELKDNFVDGNNQPSSKYGLSRLDEIINATIPKEKLYTFSEFLKKGKKWPSIIELKGKLVIVLVSFWDGKYAANEGGLKSRYEYFKNALKDELRASFVAWVEGDKGPMGKKLKNQTCFWNCDIETSKKELGIIREREIITRVDFDKINRGKHLKTYYKKNFEADYRCNFPSTDEYDKDAYNCVFPWYK